MFVVKSIECIESPNSPLCVVNGGCKLFCPEAYFFGELQQLFETVASSEKGEKLKQDLKNSCIVYASILLTHRYVFKGIYILDTAKFTHTSCFLATCPFHYIHSAREFRGITDSWFESFTSSTKFFTMRMLWYTFMTFWSTGSSKWLWTRDVQSYPS